ncbi:NADH-quinone oxidoreductase subunit NuoK [Actinocatenispora rupis]|uniref:NADH-quinone oxidoreductase subunit K n=1 Tax=Actinocatenispora rupis TaxID=519421 RepID=A0A8J3J7Y1_9ACTN|nr:NADH-quinone oxidoreductase subunit NuoK [Actinocatenispora rupis]GID15683.1 NADH-quinone oxidoreductase subunit K 1 [Actinocatenispora rupis]
MHPVIPYVVAALLFGVGVYGVLVRRNAVLLLMSIELMLNAVNLMFVTADTSIVGVPRSGQVFTLFVIVLAAAEVGVGLAVILRFFRLRASVETDGVGAATETDAPREADAPRAAVRPDPDGEAR